MVRLHNNRACPAHGNPVCKFHVFRLWLCSQDGHHLVLGHKTGLDQVLIRREPLFHWAANEAQSFDNSQASISGDISAHDSRLIILETNKVASVPSMRFKKDVPNQSSSCLSWTPNCRATGCSSTEPTNAIRRGSRKRPLRRSVVSTSCVSHRTC